MINTHIAENFNQIVIQEELIRYCQEALAFLNNTDTDITIIIEDDPFIQKLNRQYRGINSPTDVLSFDIDHIDPETGRRYLGDIIISAETASRQAQEHGVQIMDEIRLLIVHGILHLFGFDHSSPEEEREMWSKQEEIINRIKNG